MVTPCLVAVQIARDELERQHKLMQERSGAVDADTASLRALRVELQEQCKVCSTTSGRGFCGRE